MGVIALGSISLRTNFRDIFAVNCRTSICEWTCDSKIEPAMHVAVQKLTGSTGPDLCDGCASGAGNLRGDSEYQSGTTEPQRRP